MFALMCETVSKSNIKLYVAYGDGKDLYSPEEYKMLDDVVEAL